ncbi:T9SS type A sorting domain-containing protein [Hymenobacter sp. BT523]|uniref:SGNH/GDSL hydrolase family protein n=1 Tax=Hymenobacter sp. BT523 TaxID=2795725 RepID=UPI0018EAC324|nr:SGNH/GDSL hydrolase family protein [Hymenobacter sp. BT523]MBJ6110378.1 T9SS type A sorting domain-containing protein [Hymenobacter sp. BT523]
MLHLRCSWRAATRRALLRGGLAAALAGGFIGPARGQVRVLFVGNSYTHGAYDPVLTYNRAGIVDENAGLPPGHPRYEDPTGSVPGPWSGVAGIFKKFTTQASLNYEVHLEAISEVTLQYHYNNALPIIGQSKWDGVVLQEQSLLPLPVARGGQPAVFADYATRLEQAVHAANPAARVYLHQTWARADLVEFPNQPYSGSTVDVMTQDLHAAYYQLAAANGRFAGVAPVGDAWLRAMQAGVALRDPFGPPAGRVNLWAADNSHPSKWGAYLNACVLFGRLTGRDPRTLGPTEQAAIDLDIAPPAATALQTIAYQEVFGGTPLPVTLTAFAAQRLATGVQLRWATASEHNNARFAVQRSPDGTRFATVAAVPGRGTTAQPATYSTLDATAPATPLYYRLQQVDGNGAASFSPVVAVAESSPGPGLFPNPAQEGVLLWAPAATAYRVRSARGQLVAQGILAGGAATVGLTGLAPGIYLVEFQVGKRWVARRLSKQ